MLFSEEGIINTINIETFSSNNRYSSRKHSTDHQHAF